MLGEAQNFQQTVHGGGRGAGAGASRENQNCKANFQPTRESSDRKRQSRVDKVAKATKCTLQRRCSAIRESHVCACENVSGRFSSSYVYAHTRATPRTRTGARERVAARGVPDRRLRPALTHAKNSPRRREAARVNKRAADKRGRMRGCTETRMRETFGRKKMRVSQHDYVRRRRIRGEKCPSRVYVIGPGGGMAARGAPREGRDAGQDGGQDSPGCVFVGVW